MRILQINAVYGILSTGITTKQLAESLTVRHIDNQVLYGTNKQVGSNAIFIGSKYRRKIDEILSKAFKIRGYFSIISTLVAIKYLKRYKPDIVHLRNLHEYYINIPLLLKYLTQKKIATVITLHDCFFFTGYCPYYTINNCFKWKERCNTCPVYDLNTKKMFSDKEKYLSSMKNLAIVGVSDWITNEARQSTLLKNAKIITRIYNWIDLDLFKPYPKEIIEKIKEEYCLKGKFIILCVSAVWSKRKRLNDVCAIADKIGEEYRIILIGNIHDDVKLDDKIINIPTFHDVNKLIGFYSAADVFLHLSLEETFGKVTAEALACGTPAIVYNSTASPELVNENCGVVVNNIGDYDEIINAIQLVKSRGKDSYTYKCRQQAEKNFNKENNIDQYVSLYKKLIE